MFSLFSHINVTYLSPPPPNLSILLLGLDAAGKTTFLERLKTLYPVGQGKKAHRQVPVGRITSTIGLNIGEFKVPVRVRVYKEGGDIESDNNVNNNNTNEFATPNKHNKHSKSDHHHQQHYENINYVTQYIDLNIFDLGGTIPIRPLWSSYYSTVDGIIWLVDGKDKIRVEEGRIALEAVISGVREARKTSGEHKHKTFEENSKDNNNNDGCKGVVSVSVVVNKLGERKIMEEGDEGENDVDYKNGGVLKTPSPHKTNPHHHTSHSHSHSHSNININYNHNYSTDEGSDSDSIIIMSDSDCNSTGTHDDHDHDHDHDHDQAFLRSKKIAKSQYFHGDVFTLGLNEVMNQFNLIDKTSINIHGCSALHGGGRGVKEAVEEIVGDVWEEKEKAKKRRRRRRARRAGNGNGN